MRKIVVASDSYKGSLTSLQVGQIIKDVVETNSDDIVYVCPIGDGGEGTTEAIASNLNGKLVDVKVLDSLGNECIASYALLPDNSAVIEMSKASGLPQVPIEKRNPLNTTTYGVGQMIKDAIKKGCRSFIIGIGGSSTNDCGIGMLTSLGYKFLDKDNKEVSIFGRGLKDIRFVDSSNRLKELDECHFNIACDVNNPLTGKNGCSYIYGPQKGLKNIQEMDEWINNFALLTKGDKDYPGAGAAGGLGYCFKTFLNGNLESGISLILKKINFSNIISDCDLVITGEGKLDAQSIMGKAVIGVAKQAKLANKKVIAFVGVATDDASKTLEYLDAYYQIKPDDMSTIEAMKYEVSKTNLENKVKEVLIDEKRW